jgi:hypothetical protein
MTGNMPVVPTRASLSASGRPAAPSTIHNNAAQHFFGTQSASHTESFQQQTARLQQSMQQSHFSPVAAGGRATGPGATESRSAESRSASTGVGRPAAANTTPGRDVNSSVTRSAGTDAATNENRGEHSSSTHASSSQASPTRSDPNRSEWKTFTPPSHSSDSASRAASAADTLRGDGGSYWNRTAPSSGYSRESGSTNYERGAASRPQLNMRQPIVQPRSSGSYGGYHGTPSYGGSHAGSSGGASHSAPSSGGGTHSSGGGSHSSGGGHH